MSVLATKFLPQRSSAQPVPVFLRKTFQMFSRKPVKSASTNSSKHDCSKEKKRSWMHVRRTFRDWSENLKLR